MNEINNLGNNSVMAPIMSNKVNNEVNKVNNEVNKVNNENNNEVKAVNEVNNLNQNGIVNTIDNSREIVGNQINTAPKAFDENLPEGSVFDANNNKEKESNNVNKLMDENTKIDMMNKEQPASETMTDNILRAKGFVDDENSPMGLTTAQNLYDISENAVPGADVNGQVKTFENQHGIQGMDSVTGPNARRYQGYHYNDEKERPNLTSSMVLDRASP